MINSSYLKSFDFSQIVISTLLVINSHELNIFEIIFDQLLVFFINIYNFMDGIWISNKSSNFYFSIIYYIRKLLFFWCVNIIYNSISDILLYNIKPSKIFLGNAGLYAWHVDCNSFI